MFIALTVFALVAVLMSVPLSRSPAPSAPYYGVPGNSGHSVSCCSKRDSLVRRGVQAVGFESKKRSAGRFQRTVISSRRHSFQGLRPCRHPRALSNNRRRAKEFIMSKEQDNKAIVGRWFTEFWGNTWNPAIVDELCTADILLQCSLHAPRRGRADVKAFMTAFREAFPDLSFAGAADLIAEGDYVVGRWVGGGTHTGPAFSDFLMGSLPPASGRKMRFTGTTVLRVKNGKIAEEIGLDDGVTALTQLGLIRAI